MNQLLQDHAGLLGELKRSLSSLTSASSVLDSGKAGNKHVL